MLSRNSNRVTWNGIIHWLSNMKCSRFYKKVVHSPDNWPSHPVHLTMGDREDSNSLYYLVSPCSSPVKGKPKTNLNKSKSQSLYKLYERFHIELRQRLLNHHHFNIVLPIKSVSSFHQEKISYRGFSRLTSLKSLSPNMKISMKVWFVYPGTGLKIS